MLRPAEPDDARSVAGVHVRAWQVGYRGLLPDEYLDRLRPEERAARYQFDRTDSDRPATLLALEGTSVLGFATTGPSAEGDLIGELLALYVDPPQWGRGIGRMLLDAARAALVGRGFEEAVLWVIPGNERALRVYRADGWTADGIGREDEVWGITVEEVRYRRRLS
jgi:ribosomal protein S18 acetylase RimI-like enzyme